MGFALFWRRLVAGLIDGLAVTIATVILAMLAAILLGSGGAGERTLANAGWIAGLFAWWAYTAPLEAGKGTIGKNAMHLAVVASDGLRVGLGRATWRQVIQFVLFWTFPAMLLRADGRAPYDLLAGTRVVRV